jgi:radical SAM superfamily enzyme YgiQ (UPF0313 family)
MSKVLFVQGAVYENMSAMALSAFLKAHGHDVHLLVPSLERDYVAAASSYDPDIIAISSGTGSHVLDLTLALELRAHSQCTVVMGGPHATFYPETVNTPGLDAICRGEGEEAFLDLADAVDTAQPIDSIPNLWVKTDTGVSRNPVRGLIQNLDNLPFMDRSLYDRYAKVLYTGVFRVLATRGCPYDCTFCFNHAQKKLYQSGGGRYVRSRSVPNVIAELKNILSHFRVRHFRFVDDNLTLAKGWLIQLLEAYRREVRVPFTALCRADELDEDVIIALKDSGCRSVSFGIESGNERIRNSVLKKGLSNQAIVRAASLLHKHRLPFATYNILGLPTEGLSEALETLDMNIRIRPAFANCNMLMAFPGTQIYDEAHSRGLAEQVDPYLPTNLDRAIHIQDRPAIEKLQNLFALIVMVPLLRRFLRPLLRVCPNVVARRLPLLANALRAWRVFGASPFSVVRIGRHVRRSIKELGM